MTHANNPREAAPETKLVPDQATPNTTPTTTATTPDPSNRAAMVGALQDRLTSLGVHSKRFEPRPGREHFSVMTKGGSGMNQAVALLPDPEREGLWAWYWLWSDGLRGQGGITPERLCEGEDISTASTKIARVLGVDPVRV